jgi:poly-gamma-glutamate synthesis protein (capsule biosynthesis protein)
MPTLALVGDVMLGRGVAEEIGRRPPESCWGTALPLLTRADAVIANLECALTDHPRPWSRTEKVFHFRAPPEAVAVLRAGNVRCVSLANNHTLDFERTGLLDTVRHLDAAGIAHAGAGRDLAAARAPAILAVAGLKLALVSATDNEPAFAATQTEPGTFYLDLEHDPGAAATLCAALAGATPVAQVSLVSLHWGPNMVTEPPGAFRRLARAALDFATVVHGHSAHCFQGVEERGGRFILYDTGDFLDDYAVDPSLRNDWSFVFVLELTGGGVIERLQLVPVRLTYAQVNLARGAELREICRCMSRRAAAVGTTFVETADGLELPATR